MRRDNCSGYHTFKDMGAEGGRSLATETRDEHADSRYCRNQEMVGCWTIPGMLVPIPFLKRSCKIGVVQITGKWIN